MIQWQTVKEFFGFGTTPHDPWAGHSHTPAPPPPLTEGKTKSPKVGTVPNKPTAPPPAPTLKVVKPRQPQISLKKAQARKAKTNPRNYYRRGGKYYNVMDDSLIEDLLLLYVLTDLFSANDIPEYNEVELSSVAEEPAEDLLDIDISETPVVAASTIAPTSITADFSAPEPIRQESYSSGYSDSSSSDSSDSGGGSDD